MEPPNSYFYLLVSVGSNTKDQYQFGPYLSYEYATSVQTEHLPILIGCYLGASSKPYTSTIIERVVDEHGVWYDLDLKDLTLEIVNAMS